MSTRPKLFPAIMQHLEEMHRKQRLENERDEDADYNLMVKFETLVRAGSLVLSSLTSVDHLQIELSDENIGALVTILKSIEERIDYEERELYPLLKGGIM